MAKHDKFIIPNGAKWEVIEQSQRPALKVMQRQQRDCNKCKQKLNGDVVFINGIFVHKKCFVEALNEIAHVIEVALQPLIKMGEEFAELAAKEAEKYDKKSK